MGLVDNYSQVGMSNPSAASSQSSLAESVTSPSGQDTGLFSHLKNAVKRDIGSALGLGPPPSVAGRSLSQSTAQPPGLNSMTTNGVGQAQNNAANKLAGYMTPSAGFSSAPSSPYGANPFG